MLVILGIQLHIYVYICSKGNWEPLSKATDGAERAADVIFKINDFLDSAKLRRTETVQSDI